MEVHWNYNMNEAPKGYETKIKVGIKKDGEPKYKKHYVNERILTLGADGEIRQSYWVPSDNHWNMYSSKVPPIAFINYEDLKPDA